MDLKTHKLLHDALREARNGRFIDIPRIMQLRECAAKYPAVVEPPYRSAVSYVEELENIHEQNIISHMQAGSKRIQSVHVEWLRTRKSDIVALWEADKLIKSKAMSGADRVAAHSARRADIGSIPEVNESEIIQRIIDDPVWAVKHYFPKWFTRSHSIMSERAIRRIWAIIINGGMQSIGMVRGGGKSTITKALVILAGFCGIIKYMVIFAASGPKAEEVLKDIVLQIETNDQLLQDFPAACIPIRALHGRSQRAASQTYNGELTYIEYGTKKIRLANIPGMACSKFRLVCFGIEAGFLGLVDDGVRPDIVLLDDVQSMEVSNSDSAIRKLIKALQQGVTGLGGVESPLRVANLCTCTRINDFSDQMLNRDLHPNYTGERIRLIECWGTGGDAQDALWSKYCEMWKADQRAGDKETKTATQLYIDNRAVMDDGVVTNDDEFYVKGLELSTIQHAWNLRLQMTDEAYFAQMENHPIKEEVVEYSISPSNVIRLVNGLRRCVAPSYTTHLFAFADVNLDKIRWCVAAFGSSMRASVIDYGAWPEFGVVCKPNQSKLAEKAAIRSAMTGLRTHLENRVYITSDSQASILNINCLAVDRGYNAEAVQEWCTENTKICRFPILAAIGRASTQWIDKPKNAIKRGWNTVLVSNRDGAAPGDHLINRTDAMKEVVQRAWLTDTWDAPGACSLWGQDGRSHMEFADHICAEILIDKGRTSKGVEIYRWMLKPGSENHYLDVLTGVYCLASYWGVLSADSKASSAYVLQTCGLPAVMHAVATVAQAFSSLTQKPAPPRRCASVAIED